MKEYYSINEVIKYFDRQGITIDFEEICGYVREKLILPVIYIDSYPAYACEKIGDSVFAVAFCYLSAYWDIGDRIIAIIDGILRHNKIILRESWISKKEFIKEPFLMEWNFQSDMLADVPAANRNPKPFSENLKIEYFRFLEDQKLSLERKNVTLSRNCMGALISHIKNLEIKKAKGVGQVVPKNRCHLLHEVLRRAFCGECEILNRCPSASEVWNKLKNLPHLNPEKILRDFSQTKSLNDALEITEEITNKSYDPNEIIQEVTDQKIFWRNRNGDGKPLTFKSFANLISKFRNEKIFQF